LSFSPCINIVGVWRVRDVAQRGPRQQRVHEVALMREDAPFHLLVLVVIGHVVVADQVDDRGRRNRRLEDVGLGDQPRAQLTAVTRPLDAQPIAIDPLVAAHRRAQAIEDILASLPF
jgi:hypothetical protein